MVRRFRKVTEFAKETESMEDKYSIQEEITGAELKKRGYNVFIPEGFMIVDAVTNEIVEYYEFNKTNKCNTTT